MLTICKNRPDTKTFAFISGVILVILWFIALFMIIFQIVRFHKKNLPAKTMLAMQIILSVFATIALIIEVMGLFFIVIGGIKNLLDFFGTIVAT
jgi:heme/copper-type cytochrome/quinol oxidase subunit 2